MEQKTTKHEPEEQPELNDEQLKRTSAGASHPSLPNYYPILGGTDFGLGAVALEAKDQES